MSTALASGGLLVMAGCETGVTSRSRTLGGSFHDQRGAQRCAADAIKDCSKRGDTVLDPFAGSGTTLIVAETCGRLARVIEYDPLYCDTIVRRYERLTGRPGVLADSGAKFEQVEAGRLGEAVQ